MKRKKYGSICAARPRRSTTAVKSARPLRGEEEIKTKIDLSNISRPGDVLKAITQKKEAAAPPTSCTPASCACASSGDCSPCGCAAAWRDQRRRRSRPFRASRSCAGSTAASGSESSPVVERPVAPPTRHCAARGRAAASGHAASGCRCLRAAPSITASAAPQAPVAPPRPAAPTCYRTAATARAAHDRSADWTAPGIQSSAAAAGRASGRRPAHPPARCVPRRDVLCRVNRFFSVRVRMTPGGRSAASVASRRASSHASHAHRSGWSASARSWSGTSASRAGSSWCSPGCARRAGPASAMFRAA